MPIVRVELWKGATKETKAKLAKAITNDVATIANKRPQNILVLFSDLRRKIGPSAENWLLTSTGRRNKPSCLLVRPELIFCRGRLLPSVVVT